jgi:hypothetical protein
MPFKTAWYSCVLEEIAEENLFDCNFCCGLPKSSIAAWFRGCCFEDMPSHRLQLLNTYYIAQSIADPSRHRVEIYKDNAGQFYCRVFAYEPNHIYRPMTVPTGPYPSEDEALKQGEYYLKAQYAILKD